MKMTRRTPKGHWGKEFTWSLGEALSASLETKDNQATGRVSGVSVYAKDHKGEEHSLTFTRAEVEQLLAQVEWFEKNERERQSRNAWR